MKRTLITIFLLAIVPLTLYGAYSRPDGQNAVDAETLFAKAYPEMSVLSAMPTSVPGIYEVVLEGDQIVYFVPATGHLLVGSLWSPLKQNLTEERTRRLRSDRIRNLPLDKAVRIGSGDHVIIAVTDPDCPYCRKGDQFLNGRSDVTSYVFFMPLAIHPQAEKKVEYILSSRTPARAYTEVMSGAWDNRSLPTCDGRAQLAEHRRITARLGITATPAYWIDGEFIAGADIARMKSLLDDPARHPHR